jgi:hypothetical protein
MLSVKEIEEKIAALQALLIEAKKVEMSPPVKRGDKIRVIESIEWGPGAGEELYVHAVADGYIYAGPTMQTYNGTFWISNSNWYKV